MDEKKLPQYVSHKQVSAIKIKELRSPFPEGSETDGSLLLVPEEDGYAPVRVSNAYVRKHMPQVGGYWVRYQDGYESWSPAKAFEEGYASVPY